MSADADDGEFPPLGIFRRLVHEDGLGLIVLGLVVLLFVAYQLLGTTITEQHNQHRLRQSFDKALAAAPSTAPGTAPAGKGGGSGDVPTVGSNSGSTGAIPTGEAIDHLVIPAIGVDKYVVEGTSESDLSEGPGHYPQTVLPGQIGNAAIAGHRTTYGAPFFRLNNLHNGDDIDITDTSGKTFTYRVSSTEVVSPSDVAVLDPTTTAQLTLTTCNPRFGSSSRLIVVAKMAKPKPKSSAKGAAGSTTTTPGATTTVPRATTTVPGATTTIAGTATTSTTSPSKVAAAAGLNLGVGQHSTRAPAIAYGILVLLLWILTRLAIHHTRRWKRDTSCLVGIVLCLIPLWFCFENVVRLLPPNI